MDNFDELLERAQKTYDGWNNPPSPELPDGAGIVLDLATALRAQQAEIERLKSEYARGIEDAAQWHKYKLKETVNLLDSGTGNVQEEISLIAGRTVHREAIVAIRALLPKQKEGE